MSSLCVGVRAYPTPIYTRVPEVGEFPAVRSPAGHSPHRVDSEAIRAATVVTSEHVQMSKDIGTLETGKCADVVAVTADPLKNIRELEDVDFVMKGGAVFKPLD